MQIHVNKNGQQIGPYDLEEVNQYLEQGSLLPTDPAWHEGLAEWVPLNQVKGVVVSGASVPPPFDPNAFSASSSPPAAGPPMAMGTVCPQCNVTVQPDQVVCMNCGSHLHALPSAGKKGAGKLIAIIGGGVLALGAIVVVVVLVAGLGSAKSKANRMKCANNLGQITKAFHAFSGDNDGRFPWHLHWYGPEEQKFIFGKGNPEHLGTIFALEGIRESLGSPNILRSPCDPDREAIADFKGYSARENKPIPHAAISYGLCPGSDEQIPDTILSITRNVSGADLKGATFLGKVMEGLEANQGHYIGSDGSTCKADDARLKEQSLHYAESGGGISPDPPRTKTWLPK